ncbi:MAG: tetratricopeptide repeat protein [Firmicutes bacterium]|nr:tetratricopeptide repeat protein [Bacillota bacterium]
MFCRNCQTIIPDDSIFCENCGAPTGLNPEEIKVKNLVPEEAVEFEVSEDAPQVTSVPVDPVWWEPPEASAEESSWDDWDESEEIKEPQEQEAASEAEAAPETEEPEHHELPDLRSVASEAAEQARPLFEKAKSMLDGLGKSVRTGTGWAAEMVKEQLQHKEEEPSEAELPAEEEELQDREGSAEADGAAADEVEIDAPGAPDEVLEQEEMGAPEEPGASNEPWPTDQPEHPNAEPETHPKEELEPGEFAQPDESYGPEEPEEPVEAAEEGSEEDAVSQVKPYLDKAIAVLGDLGKNVVAGTERAAEAAKQQFQQKKEEFEEKKEQREKEKAEERQREEEQREQEEEARRLAEQERLEELERRREQDERELEEDMIQRPGFWYGQLEDGALEADESETEPEAENETEPEVEAAPEPEPEVEPLPEPEIEDKLADTARFSWSEEELKEAAEHGIEPDLDGAADADAQEKANADGGEDVSGDAGETEESGGEPEESSPYRIKDYEPYEGVQKKQPLFSQDRIRLIVIIAIIAAIVLSIAGVMIHQAHERQLAEEAYARSVKQAEQLVDGKKYDEAEALYLDLMAQRPEDTQLYVELAQMYVAQQRYVDAKALIKRAIKITGDEEAFKQLKKDIKLLTSNKWKKAYIKVLEDNESDIRRYEDRVSASVAVCDVNGDKKPELFFFTREYYGYGKLHIYTTVDNKAKEVEYECKNRGTQYHDAFYDVSSSDSSYAIFNSKENGKFSIYANIVHGGDPWDTTNEYSLNLNGGCKRENLIEGSIDTTYSEGDSDDSKYLQNEEEISYDKYIAAFKDMLNNSEQVILYNGSDDSGGDQAVWAKVNPDTVMCMSYDAMMVDLRAK